MARSTQQPNPSSSSRPTPGALKVSAYEQVSSLVMALLVLVSLAVVGMFIVWITNRIFTHQEPVPVIMEDLKGGDPTGVAGESLKIDAPIREEIAQETDLVEPEIEQSVELITDVAAQLLVDLDDPKLDEQSEGGKAGGSEGDGTQKGLGEGGGHRGVPRAQRWVILFEKSTPDAYARQLDGFGIELAAISGQSVEYAKGFTTGVKKRVGVGKDEQRMYMSWRSGTLRSYDLQLLARAGVKTGGKITVQFYPPEVENNLAVLETRFANRKADEIRRTTFAIRQQGNKYEFFVVDQDYL